jgi:hypothetical protein
VPIKIALNPVPSISKNGIQDVEIAAALTGMLQRPRDVRLCIASFL